MHSLPPRWGNNRKMGRDNIFQRGDYFWNFCWGRRANGGRSNIMLDVKDINRNFVGGSIWILITTYKKKYCERCIFLYLGTCFSCIVLHLPFFILIFNKWKLLCYLNVVEYCFELSRYLWMGSVGVADVVEFEWTETHMMKCLYGVSLSNVENLVIT